MSAFDKPAPGTRREFLRYLGLGGGALLVAACSPPAAAPAPTAAPAATTPPAAAGATPAAAAAAKSNGSKVTVWGWQSCTPEGDKSLGD